MSWTKCDPDDLTWFQCWTKLVVPRATHKAQLWRSIRMSKKDGATFLDAHQLLNIAARRMKACSKAM